MKRIIVILTMICSISIVSLAQIAGGFYAQNGSVFFMGTNNSGYKLVSLTIKCVNPYLQQEKTFTMNYMLNGSNFTVGEADGWTWQPGEQLFITYGNGKSVYWTYQPSTYTAPSFNNQNRSNSSSNSTTTKGNCGACNGRGYFDTNHGRESCSVCGGDGDVSFQDGNEIMNSMHELENRHNENSSSSTTSGNRCEHCRGTGYCATCNGSGVSFTTEYATNDYTICPVCKGRKFCRFCGGKGVR